MWKKTTGWLFEVQNRNGILEEKDRRLYEYAYGVLLGRVAIYLIIVILGIVTGNWLEMLVFLLPFTVLRQYAGGIHLEKAGSCMVVSSILVLLCGQYLASGSAVMWQIRIIWLAAVGVIFVMAPVDASSKKMDEKEKKVYGMSDSRCFFCNRIFPGRKRDYGSAYCFGVRFNIGMDQKFFLTKS